MLSSIIFNHNAPLSLRRSVLTVASGMAIGALIGLGLGILEAPRAGADEPGPAAAPGAVVAAGGDQMGNAFLQMLNSMLGRVVPGADSIIPSTLPQQLPGPAAPAPRAPAAPARVGQTIA